MNTQPTGLANVSIFQTVVFGLSIVVVDLFAFINWLFLTILSIEQV